MKKVIALLLFYSVAFAQVPSPSPQSANKIDDLLIGHYMRFLPGAIFDGTGATLINVSIPGVTLPSQVGKSGQSLYTNGSTPFWSLTSFASLTAKPTTLAGYGIVDAQGLNSNLSAISLLATTPFGRGALIQPDAPTFLSYIGGGSSNFNGLYTGLNFSGGNLTQLLGTTTTRGLNNEIWISARSPTACGSNGMTGCSGEQADPFDGSTQSKFDTIIAVMGSGSHVHLSADLFQTALHGTIANQNITSGNMWIQGSGMWQTTVQSVGSLTGVTSYQVFASPYNSSTDNVVISDLTCDANWPGLAGSADNGATVVSVSDGVTNGTATVTSATIAVTIYNLHDVVTGSSDFPTPCYIGSVTNATTFTLSSSPTSNVPVNALGSHAGQTITLKEKNSCAQAINIAGNNDIAFNVRSINTYGTGANGHEQFAILIGGPSGGSSYGDIIDHCRAELPWGTYGAPFALFATANSRVTESRAYGDANGVCWTTGGVNLAGVTDVQIEHNSFYRCMIAYQDTSTSERVLVAHNEGIQSPNGIWFSGSVASGATTKDSIWIRDNNIVVKNWLSGYKAAISLGNATSTKPIISGNTISFDTSGPGSTNDFRSIDATALSGATITFNTLDPSYNQQWAGSSTCLLLNRSFTGAVIPGLLDNAVAAIVATGRVTAQTAANASIATFTVGSSDGSFEVSMNMNVTAAGTISSALTCAYTDESNTSRTMILPVTSLAGTFLANGLVVATGAYETPVMHIRCKAGTTITLYTALGTYTTVVYTAEGIIQETQ